MMRTVFAVFLLCIYSAVAAPQDGGENTEQKMGSILQSAGAFFDKNKLDVTALLGLAGDGEQDGSFLTKILQKLNLDPAMITNLSNSLTSQEGVTKVLAALKDPSSLPAVLGEQTGMNQGAIDSVSNSIQEALRKVKETAGGGAAKTPSETCLALIIFTLLARIVV